MEKSNPLPGWDTRYHQDKLQIKRPKSKDWQEVFRLEPVGKMKLGAVVTEPKPIRR